MAAPRTPVAAVDCGTNSTRLLIADPDGTARLRLMRITRLGASVDATGELEEAAVARTVAVLREFRRAMDEHGVGRVRLVATSAARDAGNGGAFLAEASRTVGVTAELLSGDEEGRRSFAGATAGLAPAPGGDAVVDIGGGSTELVVGVAGVVSAISLQIGCVRVSERYLRRDPPSAGQLDEAVAAIDRALDRARRALPGLTASPPPGRLIGLAGTVSTLAALHKGLADYVRDEIHGTVLSLADVTRWCATLAAEPAAARLARPGMARGREDVIVGGALVLRQVMGTFGFERCTVSESDILDGLVGSLLER